MSGPVWGGEATWSRLGDLLAKLEALAKALESVSQDALLVKGLDIDLLLKTVLGTPLARLAVDSAGRLRIIIDAAGIATPVSGTVAVTKSGTWTLDSQTITAGGVFPVDQRFELMQRANIEYNECQRRKFTFS